VAARSAHAVSVKVGGREILVSGRLLRVARPAVDLYESIGDPGATLQALRECSCRIDLFTFMQTLGDRSPGYPYTMEWDNVAAMPISTFEHWWTKQINDKTRNVVRLAEKKGIVVREVPFDDPLVEGIAAVYNESPVRQGKPFWHYGKDLQTVRREHATFLERSVFIGAFLQNELVGFVKLVCDDDRTQAGLMQIISMIRHRDKAPTNALIAQAVRSCASREIPHLVYGKFTYGNKQPDSLSDFKRHNGFRRVHRPRYYLPLTAVGRTALRLGLHRGLIDRIPGTVLARLRTARQRWYDRLLPSRAGMNAP
jgi:hypothetical protein